MLSVQEVLFQLRVKVPTNLSPRPMHQARNQRHRALPSTNVVIQMPQHCPSSRFRPNTHQLIIMMPRWKMTRLCETLHQRRRKSADLRSTNMRPLCLSRTWNCSAGPDRIKGKGNRGRTTLLHILTSEMVHYLDRPWRRSMSLVYSLGKVDASSSMFKSPIRDEMNT